MVIIFISSVSALVYCLFFFFLRKEIIMAYFHKNVLKAYGWE